jgi:hypothetical protein
LRPHTLSIHDHDSLRNMHVDVSLDSLTQSTRGAIFGEVSVRVDGREFPGPRWNDFVVIVLGWWSEKCAALLRGASCEEFLFMDGPFLFTVEAISQHVWSVRFLQLRGTADPTMVESGAVPGLPDSFPIRPLTLARSLAITAGAVFHECARRGWTTTEVDQLHRENNVLRSLLGMGLY